uniref:diphthine methyl ester synthase n=1 Tax=Octactis speculum TaxID=3111310 RepID=A0A7S2GEP7_9STRA|mmetsp:Transcript_46362/g.63122  ORF Transcript_46362/g.63122 Transcript_46362/m.63122 type:complete len:227 (+) Transcript_46362:313-993(+)
MGYEFSEEVAFLVVGDPLCATTHTDMMIRARDFGVEVKVIHNASVMGAIAGCGLQLYSFGLTVSIPFFDEKWRPDSFYDKIGSNRVGKMHTLALLDIKVKEPDYEAMMKGRTQFLPPRYMTVSTAVAQLLEIEGRRQEGHCLPSSLGVGMARLGQPTQQIAFGTLEELLEADLGGPLHCLVLCTGDLHDLEMQFMAPFRVGNGATTNDTTEPPPAVSAAEEQPGNV